jgi:hypothetical protein
MTYRAAYILSSPDSTGAGVVLTTPEDSHLPEEELIALASETLLRVGGDHDLNADDVVIGPWKEMGALS